VSALAWAGVAALGAAGALLRFALDGAVASRSGRSFPSGTLAVNASGAFLLGLVAGLALNGDALVLAGGAALGSFTTFSTWMLETQRLVEEGDLPDAVRNLLISVAVGLAAVALGRLAGEHL
jgi:fluoride exporter